ncbi:MAG: tetratricopeptide repeat protein [Vulcanimicrobiota bacterium]
MRIAFAKRLVTVLVTLGLLAVPALSQAHSPELEAGMQAFYQEDWDGAQAHFEDALKKNPQDSLAMAFMLHAAYKKKEINEIINRIEQKAVSRGEDPTALAHLGMGYFLRGMIIPNQMEESVTEFKQAIKDDPNVAIAYTGLGMVYFQKRMMPRAKGYFVRALRINPHDIMAMELLANIMLVDEKKPEDARQLFERITAELPTYPDGFYYLGSSLYDLDRAGEAIPYLIRARELDPKGLTKGFDAASLLGDALMKENRVNEAIQAYEKALSIRPDSQYVDTRLRQARGESV